MQFDVAHVTAVAAGFAAFTAGNFSHPSPSVPFGYLGQLVQETSATGSRTAQTMMSISKVELMATTKMVGSALAHGPRQQVTAKK